MHTHNVCVFLNPLLPSIQQPQFNLFFYSKHKKIFKRTNKFLYCLIKKKKDNSGNNDQHRYFLKCFSGLMPKPLFGLAQVFVKHIEGDRLATIYM